MLLGILRYKHLPDYLRAVVFLLSVTFLSELVGRYLAYAIHNSNPVYHFYSALELACLGGFFYKVSKVGWIKKASIVIYAGLILISCINSLYFQTFYQFNSNIDLIKMPVTFLVSAIVLINLFFSDTEEDASFWPRTIAIIAFFWFNAASFVFYVFYNFFLNNGFEKSYLNILHFVSNIIFYFLLFISLVVYNLKTNHAKC